MIWELVYAVSDLDRSAELPAQVWSRQMTTLNLRLSCRAIARIKSLLRDQLSNWRRPYKFFFRYFSDVSDTLSSFWTWCSRRTGSFFPAFLNLNNNLRTTPSGYHILMIWRHSSLYLGILGNHVKILASCRGLNFRHQILLQKYWNPVQHSFAQFLFFGGVDRSRFHNAVSGFYYCQKLWTVGQIYRMIRYTLNYRQSPHYEKLMQHMPSSEFLFVCSLLYWHRYAEIMANSDTTFLRVTWMLVPRNSLCRPAVQHSREHSPHNQSRFSM